MILEVIRTFVSDERGEWLDMRENESVQGVGSKENKYNTYEKEEGEFNNSEDEEVAETDFMEKSSQSMEHSVHVDKEISADPFGLNDLLGLKKPVEENLEPSPSLSHPPGFSPVGSLNSSDKELNKEFSPTISAKGDCFGSADEMIVSGRAMGYSMEGRQDLMCTLNDLKEMEDIDFRPESKSQMARVRGREPKSGYRLRASCVYDEVRLAVWDCESIVNGPEGSLLNSFGKFLGRVYNWFRISVEAVESFPLNWARSLKGYKSWMVLSFCNDVLDCVKERKKKALVFNVDFAEAYDSVSIWTFDFEGQFKCLVIGFDSCRIALNVSGHGQSTRFLEERDLDGGYFPCCEDTRLAIDDLVLPSHSEPTRWVKLIPIKINVFMWRARRGCLPTRYNLVQKGVILESTSCPVCFSDEEDVHHLLFRCSLSKGGFASVFAVGGMRYDFQPLAVYKWLEENIESVIGINKDDIDEEDDESSTMEPPSRNEAIKDAQSTLNTFLVELGAMRKQHQEVLTMLKKIRDEIQGEEIDFQTKKQKTIESFFKKTS
ncbi:RNA-directed DNA polymerase, eukaryota [Tanacetum coccineum]|uniref:RNA-directed DNA polymerase, eukaryota n=1 Tax=Tanacetum coccineum TaxID=301880 RepID=A0ABQ4Y5N1_9ASTR